MKLIFLKGKKSNNPTQPDELTYTLNVLPSNLAVSTLLEIGQNILPIDNNLTNEPPTLAVSTLLEIGQNILPIDNNLTNEPPTLAVSTAVSAQ